MPARLRIVPASRQNSGSLPRDMLLLRGKRE